MANLNRFPAPPVEDLDLPINYDSAHWTIRRRVRDQYVQEQKGLCYHCQRPLNREPSQKNVKQIDKNLFPAGFFEYPVHLHHSHDTGLTIGAVHSYCNAILWQFYGE